MSGSGRPAAHEPVPPDGEPGLARPCLPAGAGADRGRVLEQSVLLLLVGDAGELGVQRVLGVDEGLLLLLPPPGMTAGGQLVVCAECGGMRGGTIRACAGRR